MGERVWNLPNAITLLRLLAAPVVVWLVIRTQWEAACWLFLVAALSDSLDGYLARRLGQTTAFGAALDAVTDKALGLGTLVTLTLMGAIPLWVTIAILLRDTVLAHSAQIIELGLWQLPLFMLVAVIAAVSGIQYVWIWSRKVRRE